MFRYHKYCTRAIVGVVCSYAKVLVNWRGIASCAACGLGIVTFYISDYTWLCHGFARCMASLFAFTGLHAAVQGTYITVGGIQFCITSECVYLDWLLIATPFIWRYKSFGGDLRRSLVLVVVASCGNMLRAAWAIFAYAIIDASWFWCHDLVDFWTWYVTLCVVIGFWFRSLRKQLSGEVKQKAYNLCKPQGVRYF